ncbi:MAG: hypothetical protein ABUT20_17050 [Bacteroidota bacterium]
MNRPHFIYQSITTLVAAIMLPLAFSMFQESPVTYESDLYKNKTNQWFYEVKIFHSLIDSFSTAGDATKKIVLTERLFETNDFDKSTQLAGFEYIITGMENSKKSSINTVFKAKFIRKIFGDHEVPKQFPKELKFELRKWSYIDILGKNDEALAQVVHHDYDTDAYDDY